MALQDQVQALQEQNADLVGYVQEYQGKLAEAQFQAIQANGNARKLAEKLEQVQRELSSAQARLDGSPEAEGRDADDFSTLLE